MQFLNQPRVFPEEHATVHTKTRIYKCHPKFNFGFVVCSALSLNNNPFFFVLAITTNDSLGHGQSIRKTCLPNAFNKPVETKHVVIRIKLD